MPMYNPPHPGEHVRMNCLEPLELTVTAGANVLGVSRKALSELVNGHAGISPEMAIRLEKAFGSTADHWMRLQAAYELARARQHEEDIKVQRFELA
jgi:addiction module HigA family antidote